MIDGIERVSDDELYRAMDFLLACSERVPESVFCSLANLLNLEVDVIFFVPRDRPSLRTLRDAISGSEAVHAQVAVVLRRGHVSYVIAGERIPRC